MADLLELSSRFIDENQHDGPRSVNRPTTELSEVADGIAVMEAFSHVVILKTEAGLVLFDTSLEAFAEPLLKSMRTYSKDPVHSIVYTHGHIDHVGGTRAFIDETVAMGAPRPRVVGHENVSPRFGRYRDTSGYNLVINARQFGPQLLGDGSKAATFGPSQFVSLDTSFRERLQLQVGELSMELRHDRGETDDHLWAWIPEHKAIAVGDFLIWAFPNAGNPQKVQRYPREWAHALRQMAALQPELLLPAHGLPIGGRERIQRVLGDIATALEGLVDETVAMMNAGASLDEIVHTVKVSDELLGRPFMQPVYDEPEFVVRNIWRLYGGWYDGNPANLKPARESTLAAEIASLAGGAEKLATRARELADGGDYRTACHLAQLAVQAEPDSKPSHAARAEIFAGRRKHETSLMAKGIFKTAADESKARADE